MANNIITVTVPLKDGSWRDITAVQTAVPTLAITPAVHQRKDGTVTLGDGYLQLMHVPTGRTITNGSCKRLEELAGLLAPFGWDFTDPAHFKSDDTKDELARIKAVIWDWELSEGSSGGPVAFPGETDDVVEARRIEPATTMLREHIAGYLKNDSDRSKIKYEDNKELWYASIAYACESYGLVYLLAVLRSINPEIADIAARDLLGAWDCGEFGEWVYQWGQELAAGRPLTLHGIPTADPLADFS